MIRPFRLLATTAAVAAVALGVTARFVRADPEQPVEVAFRDSVSNPARGDEAGEYRLDRLPILSRVVLAVKDQYVDPSRIDPKQMVVSALEMVEKTVAEVMVQGDAKGPRLTLTVGAAQRELDISAVDSLWDVRKVLGEAMGFVQEHLVAHKDLVEIEYAAVNGMLSTLDPHTTLLEPKYFKEMKLQTRGEFGGLGFVIAMRDGRLTVVKVLKGTPAARAGVRAKDVITKIEEQSTVEMDLQDAVDRLRGKPQTRVSITIARAGAEPKRLPLVREVISVETVPQAQLLSGKVGYIRLSQFSLNTTRDLRQAIDAQRAAAGGALSGLVLDLRGNPGGLLEQAVQVADLFLSEGVIVKTVVGGARARYPEVHEASADGRDFADLPLVVLVNNSSASASEIVAGALKNDGRALVVGRQSFGKGSVQILYDDLPEVGKPGDKAALKLTIAQYLTPGDVSIQEVGITPDVMLTPGRALKEQINFFAPPRSMGEADLDRHLRNPADASQEEAAREAARRKKAEKAPFELRYLLDESEDQVAKALRKEEAAPPHDGQDGIELTPEQVEDEEADADPDKVVEDYQIRFARELLTRAPGASTRARLLEAARGFVAERAGEEEARLEKRLGELGVDWSTGPASGTPRAVVTMTPAAAKDVRAGETLSWTVTVENRGDGPFRRLRAWTSVEKNALLDRREFVFGTVRPGERRSWTVPVRIPKGMDSRRDEVTLQFEEANGRAPDDVKTSVGVVELPKPVFAFSVQLDDSAGGNGDGLAQRGEKFTVHVDVKNGGTGASGEKTWVSLKNLGDEKLFIEKGRDVLGALRPGEVKSATMEVDLRKGSKSETVPIRVTIYDEKMDEYVSEKIEWPVTAEGPPRTAATGAVRVEAAEAQIRVGAGGSAAEIATARRGAVLPVNARYGDFYRVEWQKGRVGFVAAEDVKPAKGPRAGVIALAWQREPPRIALNPDPAKGSPVVDSDSWKLTGTASVPPNADPNGRLRDVFVFVNDQKVFFKVVSESAGAQKLDFTTDLPLEPGQNVVTVFAREDEEFQARRSLVIFRRPPDAVAADAASAPPRRQPQ